MPASAETNIHILDLQEASTAENSSCKGLLVVAHPSSVLTLEHGAAVQGPSMSTLTVTSLTSKQMGKESGIAHLSRVRHYPFINRY